MKKRNDFVYDEKRKAWVPAKYVAKPETKPETKSNKSLLGIIILLLAIFAVAFPIAVYAADTDTTNPYVYYK